MKKDVFIMSKRISILYTVISVVAIVAIILTGVYAWWYSNRLTSNEGIFMDVTSDNSSQLSSVSFTKMLPSHKRTQDIVVTNQLSLPIYCDITLLEAKDSELAPYLEVSIYYEDEQIFSGDMIDAFQRSIDLGTIKGNSTKQFKVVYYMKDTSDNDAQAKKVVFDINLVGRLNQA